MNYELRLKTLRRTLPKLKTDALVISHLTNVRYLCGYTGTAGMLVVTGSDAWFITDFRYQAQAAQQIGPYYDIIIADRGLWPEAASLLKKAGTKTIAFEAEHTSVASLQDIEKLVKPATALPTTKVVEELRLYKDADEIAVIKRAVKVIDEAFAEICKFIKPGLTESEVSDELTRQMRLRGASGPSFDTIVASGVRGALPHGVASDKVIDNGDMITIDMGAIVDGYCSDCTRTVVLGKPTKEQQRIYGLVWDAQTAASAALRPGLSCKAADQVARGIIEEAGLGAAFGHGLGHGVGIDIHEQPRLSRLGKGNLKPGMVVTSEPGIYLDGWGGVRIEDMLLITEDGAETLTKCKKPRKIISL